MPANTVLVTPSYYYNTPLYSTLYCCGQRVVIVRVYRHTYSCPGEICNHHITYHTLAASCRNAFLKLGRAAMSGTCSNLAAGGFFYWFPDSVWSIVMFIFGCEARVNTYSGDSFEVKGDIKYIICAQLRIQGQCTVLHACDWLFMGNSVLPVSHPASLITLISMWGAPLSHCLDKEFVNHAN